MINPIQKIALTLILFLDLSISYAMEPIVYSRCARTNAEFEIKHEVNVGGIPQQASRIMKGLDVYDVLPDVTNFLSGFSAPCDLIYRDSQGVESTLYDCSSTSTDASSCAALDPAVSFDGKTVAFSVFRGELYRHKELLDSRIIEPSADPGSIGWIELPNKKLKTTGAHLHSTDITSGTVSAMPFEEGLYESGPSFLSNGRIAFTSNRDNNTSTNVWRSSGSSIGTRIWTVDRNWKNLDLASHHSLSQEQHPYLLKNGRLAYSSWQILGAQPFRYTNGSVGSFTTLGNLFHIYTQKPDGAENFAFYGQHSGDHIPSYFGVDHKASHFITQTSDERVWFADYYRRNNMGLGVIVGIMAEPDGQEGIAPEDASSRGDIYAPRDAINFASWASSSDNPSSPIEPPEVKHPNYSHKLIFSGKVGHPTALTNNGLMLAWGKGACSSMGASTIFTALGLDKPPMVSGSGAGAAMNMMTHLNYGTPGCDIGLYRATMIPSLHPSDLEMVVDSPEWHEIMGRAVVPYSEIHGIEKPIDIPRSDLQTSHLLLPKGTPFGLLGAASITDRETHPKDGIKFAGEHQFNLQGTDTINYNDEDLCGVRILSLRPNRSRNVVDDISNLFGERVGIIGEFPVINRDQSGDRIIDPSGNPDTSFLVRFPANSPYLMQGIDCNGRTLNTDMTWQSLRPGEQKTCGGCHVHSKPSRVSFDQTFAATSEYTVPRLGEGFVPLLTGISDDTIGQRSVPGYSLQIDFSRDIYPIFSSKCTSCHGGNSPAADLSLSSPGDHDNKYQTPSTWWCLVGDHSQNCLSDGNRFITGEGSNGTTFRRPQVTRYIRAFNSLGSLLYWKAANIRTDNNSDSIYSDDIDFGEDHPTAITPDELGLLSRWIDLGSPGGPQELLDTSKPTLTLAASVQDNSITSLKVGTVDIGSGIDPNSLIVCVLGSNGSCTNIAGPAETHGITTVPVSLSEPSKEIYTSVRDFYGNETEVQRTVGFFTNDSGDTIDPVQNHAPSSVSASITTTSNTVSQPVTLIIDDPDEGDSFVISVKQQPNHGQVEVISYQVVYTPDINYVGSDSMIITATDAGGLSKDGFVEILVKPEATDISSGPSEKSDGGGGGSFTLYSILFFFYYLLSIRWTNISQHIPNYAHHFRSN